MNLEYVKYEIHERVVTITLNNPDQFNILSLDLMNELNTLIKQLNESTEVVIAILTGSGKVFSAGADLKVIKKLSAAQCTEYNKRILELFATIENSTIPIMASVNGHAFGGGLEMALACCYRVSSDDVKMGLPEVKLGILPGAGGTQRLPRLISKSKALFFLLSGDTITAQEAEKLGMVDHVVPREQLLEYCTQLAERIAQNPPLAVRAIKKAVTVGSHLPLEEAIAYTEIELEALNKSMDRTEGINAFLEKRKPHFVGK